jgi:hypothetical protein
MDLGAIALTIIGVIWLCAIAYVLWIPAHEWNTHTLLKRYGIDGTAQVSSLAQGIGRGPRYFVIYKVEPESISVMVTQEIGYEKYRVLRDGAKVAVRYSPANPQIARLAGYDEDLTIRNKSSFFAIIIMVPFPPFILLFLMVFLLDRTISVNKFIDSRTGS